MQKRLRLNVRQATAPSKVCGRIYEVASSRAAHGRSNRNNVRGGGRLLPYGANSFVRSIDDLSKPCAVLPQEPIRRLAVCSLLNDGSFGRTLCERRPAFFDEMALRRAREQQQQMDAGGGQAASRTRGRRQVQFLGGGGTSEKRRVGPWTPRYLKGQGKVCQ